MAYLLELVQEDRRSVVGVFGSEADVLSLVKRLPGLHSDANYSDFYWLEPTEVPELTEIEHNGWLFPLCRASFSTYPSDGRIYVIWNEVQIFDETPPHARSYCAGTMSINGYTFGMEEGVDHVHAREKLFDEAKEHFVARGEILVREALGSQDGEYVAVLSKEDPESSRLVFLLDLAAVHLRAQLPSFEEFLSRYPDDL